MYEGLKAAIRKAVANPKIIKVGGATIYHDGNQFSYAPHVHGNDNVDNGNAFIRVIMANEDSYSWLPLSQEAKNNQSYLSSLINGEITEAE